ncbi:MAG TPA: hypothetical protein VF220_07245 [Nitrososphaeraceae archaeon]
MVETRKMKLNIQLHVDIPMDIIEDKQRLKAIEDGILKVISRSMYEECLSFNIVEAKFDV